MKKLSVITINYNNRDGLQKTIEGVINQTFTDYEYIVIDGGSTDGSTDVIRKYAEKIDYWVSEPDKGIYHAMNKGILKAQGEYCNFINSGDYYTQNNILEQIFCQPQSEDILSGLYRTDINQELNGHLIPLSMLSFVKTSIGHPSSFIKRNLFNNHLYDERFKIVSDWKFFIESVVFQNCTVKNIPEIVAVFDSTGISSTSRELEQQEKDTVLQELLPERIYKDYVYFIHSDSSLLQLTPYFNKTKGFQKCIYRTVYVLIRIRLFIHKLIGRN